MSHISTDPYKGVRDFYPDDMAVQQYIFDTWSRTAESFGYERYDASVLEPSELYKSKGAENEELVNEQTYTFVDRGEREVTLRPEMTPTVARMIAGRHKELAFPVRWYSTPNLFRYERSQRGRVREHWQLNCDIFGSDDISADVEIIALAYQVLINFGATPDMFEIRVNSREEMRSFYASIGINDDDVITRITRLNDRKRKVSAEDYREELLTIVDDDESVAKAVIARMDQTDIETPTTRALSDLGIVNVIYDPSIARGFDYYTGTVFEIFDTDEKNNRSMLGGGRYDNLTSLFGGEKIGGVGFGMGDVTMRDFLESHKLFLPKKLSPQMVVVPTDSTFNIDAERVAICFREAGLRVSVDIGTKKLGKKISSASDAGVGYVIVVGEDEITRGEYVVKNLADATEISGTLEQLAERMATNDQ